MKLEYKRSWCKREMQLDIRKVVQEVTQSEIVQDKWRGREFDHWSVKQVNADAARKQQWSP